MPPDRSRGRTLSPRARGDANEPHGTLERLLDGTAEIVPLMRTTILALRVASPTIRDGKERHQELKGFNTLGLRQSDYLREGARRWVGLAG
jgi:hypothetical protein